MNNIKLYKNVLLTTSGCYKDLTTKTIAAGFSRMYSSF